MSTESRATFLQHLFLTSVLAGLPTSICFLLIDKSVHLNFYFCLLQV